MELQCLTIERMPRPSTDINPASNGAGSPAEVSILQIDREATAARRRKLRELEMLWSQRRDVYESRSGAGIRMLVMILAVQ